MTIQSTNAWSRVRRFSALAMLIACGAGMAAVGAAAGADTAPPAPPMPPAKDAPSAERESGFRIEKVKGDNAPRLTAEQVEGGSSNMYVTTDSGVVVRVRRSGDELKISVNGKRLGAERMTDDSWSQLRVLDEDGEVLATLVKTDRGSLRAVSGEWDESKQRELEGVFADSDAAAARIAEAESRARDTLRETMRRHERAFAAARSPLAGQSPRVMMGLTMDQPTDAVAHQIGVDPDQATLITNVTKGLPAEKAGLQEFDVIVKVDGKTPADEATIRKALREKNPGDTISFEIVRKGERKDITVTLDAYDPAKLRAGAFGFGQSSGGGADSGGSATMPPGLGILAMTDDNRADLEEKSRDLARLSEKLSELAAKIADQQGAASKDAARQMAELGEKLSKIGAELAEQYSGQSWTFPVPRMREELLRQFGSQRNPQMRIFRTEPGQPPVITVIPDAADEEDEAGAPESGAAEKNELHGQIGKLNDRMGGIDERLAKLEELLRQLAAERQRGTTEKPPR